MTVSRTVAKNKQPFRGMALLSKPVGEKAHPNLFETIELIKNEQASTEVQRIQLVAGGQPRPKAVRHDEQVSKLVAELSNGQRTLAGFLSFSTS